MSDESATEQAWEYPCGHIVTAPDIFTPSEFCPVCRDARGPSPVDDYDGGDDEAVVFEGHTAVKGPETFSGADNSYGDDDE